MRRMSSTMRLWFGSVAFAFCFLLSVVPGTASEGDHVASVRKVKGTVFVERGGKSFAAAPGVKILLNDILRTEGASSLGLVFQDDSRLSVGPSSAVVVEDFLFSPGEKKFSLVTRVLKGTVSYISGLIGRLSPDSVRFETPRATLGIRGTHLLVSVE